MVTLATTFNFHRFKIPVENLMLYIKRFVFSPIEENTYVLYNDEGTACIIDPGCYHEDEQNELAGFISKEKLTPELLLNTHCHLDHVFGLRWASEKYGLIPHLHFSEKQMLMLAPLNGDMWNLPFKGYNGDLHYVNEGETLKVGSDTLAVLLVPGHSPGHLCFYSGAGVTEEGKLTPGGFLIGGDVLFRQSIGRTDLPGGNHEALLENIREKLFILPDNTVVFTGHGENTTIGDEKKYNPYLRTA